MNVFGTKAILDLAHKMAKLKAFIHVSTAYCHCTRDEIGEKLYLSETFNLTRLRKVTKDMDGREKLKVLGDYPNTYTFTKAAAEQVLHAEKKELKVAIVRPSIIVAAIEEPHPGWVDNLNGPTGVYQNFLQKKV